MKLVITEKPSVGRIMATVLGAKKREEGYFVGGGYIVSWCLGHLVGIAESPEAYDERYAKWRLEDLPIIPEKFKHIPKEGTVSQLKVLKDLMKHPDVTEVINACDAGREGELIFRLVYEYRPKCKLPTKRLWISSLEEAAIKEGFNNLKDGKEYDNLYKAAACRTEADWIVGINLSRLFTILYRSPISVGRVQSPTLALVVARDEAISNFVKEIFYTPVIDCGEFKARFGERLDDAAAQKIIDDCAGNSAKVANLESQKKTTSPPKLFDLTALQREANKLYGYTAADTLSYTQNLYEKKLVTYPRTDSKFLTEDMLPTLPPLAEAVLRAYPHLEGDAHTGYKQIVDNKKVGDHHGIIPTIGVKSAAVANLSEAERNILDLVSARFIAAISPKFEYLHTTATLECGGHSFVARGKITVIEGFKAVDAAFKARKNIVEDAEDTPEGYDEGDDDGDAAEGGLPKMEIGDIFENCTAEAKQGSTTPPKPHTEDSLLRAMETAGADEMDDDVERKGLGTPATRAETIEKLIKKEFIFRDKKKILSTAKGRNTIKVLPEAVKSPSMTAEWENLLKMMRLGEASDKGFMADITNFVNSIVNQNQKADEAFKPLLAKAPAAAPPRDPKDILGPCPRCKEANVNAVEIKPKDKETGKEKKKVNAYLCENRNCGFALWEDNRYFTNIASKITKTRAKSLINKGSVHVKKLVSQRTGNEFSATISLDNVGNLGERAVSFKMEVD